MDGVKAEVSWLLGDPRPSFPNDIGYGVEEGDTLVDFVIGDAEALNPVAWAVRYGHEDDVGEGDVKPVVFAPRGLLTSISM